MKISKVIKKLDSLYPKKHALLGDKVGLQIGDTNLEVTNILVALDLTKKNLNYAINNEINLIIIHHAFFFEDDLNVEFKRAPYKESMVTKLKNTGIVVYVVHTNFNIAKEGSGFLFFEKMELKVDKQVGEIAVVSNFKGSLNELILQMKKNHNLRVFQHNIKDINDKITRVGFIPGSGSIDDMLACKQDGADVIITSDIKWSQWLTCKQMGINLVQISHVIEDSFVDKIYDDFTSNKKMLASGVKVIKMHSSELSKLL